MQQSSNALFFSAASVWELELKSSKGKLRLPEAWIQAALDIGITELAITADACMKSTRFPWNHKDPFDRLLFAQALEQKLTFATRDGFTALYGIPVLKVYETISQAFHRCSSVPAPKNTEGLTIFPTADPTLPRAYPLS